MASGGNLEDYQFDPNLFKELQEQVGEFSVDVVCDSEGRNSVCSKFCSRENGVFQQSLAGESVWCCPPFK